MIADIHCPRCTKKVLSHYYSWFCPPIEQDIQCAYCKEWLELSRVPKTYAIMPLLMLINGLTLLAPGLLIFMVANIPHDSVVAWMVYLGLLSCSGLRFMIFDYRPRARVVPTPVQIIYIAEENEDM